MNIFPVLIGAVAVVGVGALVGAWIGMTVNRLQEGITLSIHDVLVDEEDVL